MIQRCSTNQLNESEALPLSESANLKEIPEGCSTDVRASKTKSAMSHCKIPTDLDICTSPCSTNESFRNCTAQTHTYLCEDWLAIMSHHESLFTVKDDGRILEGLFTELQDVVKISNTAFKHAPEVSRNKTAANR